MNLILMTKNTTPVIGQLAVLLGWIMNAIFNFFAGFGIENIGVCIIFFTLITALILLPITFSQQKFTKVNSLMQPEMQAIQAKYRGKTDQASVAKQNAEMQNLYDKYGVSPTGSCLPLLIQLPIIFALYQVILNVPAYVTRIKDVFMNIATPLMQETDFVTKITELASSNGLPVDRYDYTQADRVVDLLYKLSNTEWETLKGIFPNISDTITTNVATINQMNSFLTINLAETPWEHLLSAAILIPILAGVSQYAMTKVLGTPSTGDDQSQMMQSMKTMNLMMPLMSVFFCFTLPAAVGLYWVASSVIRLVLQLGVNKYMEGIDVNDMIKANIEKKNRKRERQGLPPINEQAMMQRIEKAQAVASKEQEKVTYDKEKRDAAQAKSTEYYKSRGGNPGSISSKARMVKDFNERNMRK